MKQVDRTSHQQSIPLQSVENHWKLVFDKYDVNGDGQIPLNYLSHELQGTKFNHDIPSHTVNKILKKYDSNQDGYLSFSEFLKLLEHEEGRALFGQYLSKFIYHTIPGSRNTRRVVARTVTDGEYEEQYSCFPPPVALLLISLIELSFFAYDLTKDHNSYVDGPLATLFIYNPHRRKEAWRFLTYMFVHIGVFHLMVNLLVQIILGVPLEMVHGWYRVLTVYFFGVIAGSLATSVTDPRVYLAGASGGVYALIAAHLATIIINWSEMEYAFIQLIIFLFISVVDIGTAVYNRYFLDIVDQVGYVAHLGGALAGLFLGLKVLRNLEVHKWEKILCWVTLVVFSLLMGTAIVWNIAVPSYFPYQTV